MKKIAVMLAAAAIGGASFSAKAQYYDMVNQVTNMVQNAIIGGMNYKGYVEAEYVQGFGNNSVNFLNFTTTQGFSYASWFYMGAGAGVDIAFSNLNQSSGDRYNISTTSTGVMIPLYTDFRFTVGQGSCVGVNLGIRLGGTFLISNSYLELNNGYLSNKQYFYMRPYLGVRVPLNAGGSKQAVDFGLSYQLITSNNFCYWGGNPGSNVTLNGLGFNVTYEW